VWKLRPEFPGNILWLKSLNLIFVWVALVGFAWLVKTSRFSDGPSLTPLLMLGLLGTCPGVVSFADYTMSDTLFLAVVVLGFSVSESVRDTDAWGQALLTAAVCGLAVATRMVGMALAAALVIDTVLRKLPRRAGLGALAAIATTGGWYAWTLINRGAAGPILAYYEAYETSALGHLFSDPRLSLNIVAGNLLMARDSGQFVFGPAFTLWPAFAVLIALGIPTVLRAGHRSAVLFAACYCPIVLVHPFAPHRYLVPLVPVLLLLLLAGTNRCHRWLAGPRVSLGFRTTGQVLITLTVLGLLGGNLARYRFRLTPMASGDVRGWYGQDMGYSWAGFEETFDWIRRNTDPGERLGTIFDPMYYLYTGRQGVRPWIHQPETYFYPYAHATPAVGDPSTVAAELGRLGITYLVLDPPQGYAEGDAAIGLMRAIIRLPSVNGTLVFASRDGRHEVYRLQRSGSVVR
jgi:hypothetical protein